MFLWTGQDRGTVCSILFCSILFYSEIWKISFFFSFKAIYLSILYKPLDKCAWRCYYVYSSSAYCLRCIPPSLPPTLLSSPTPSPTPLIILPNLIARILARIYRWSIDINQMSSKLISLLPLNPFEWCFEGSIMRKLNKNEALWKHQDNSQ